jgi:hypothetical protein
MTGTARSNHFPLGCGRLVLARGHGFPVDKDVDEHDECRRAVSIEFSCDVLVRTVAR